MPDKQPQYTSLSALSQTPRAQPVMRAPTWSERLSSLGQDFYEGLGHTLPGQFSDALGLTGFSGIAQEMATPQTGVQTSVVLPFAGGKAIQAARAAEIAEATEAARLARRFSESSPNGRGMPQEMSRIRQILTDPRLGGDDSYLVTARTLSPTALARERFRVQQKSAGLAPSEIRQHLQYLDQVEQERAAMKHK